MINNGMDGHSPKTTTHLQVKRFVIDGEDEQGLPEIDLRDRASIVFDDAVFFTNNYFYNLMRERVLGMEGTVSDFLNSFDTEDDFLDGIREIGFDSGVLLSYWKKLIPLADRAIELLKNEILTATTIKYDESMIHTYTEKADGFRPSSKFQGSSETQN